MTRKKRTQPQRRLSRRSMLSGLGVAAATVAGAGVARAACSVTAYQIDGPFYPYTTGEQDWDLTHIATGSDRAAGEVIEVVGKIQDAKCRPVGDCVLEIWQANVHGRYDHPKDGNPAPVDPNFQGYARIVADKNGEYRFRTIRTVRALRGDRRLVPPGPHSFQGASAAEPGRHHADVFPG